MSDKAKQMLGKIMPWLQANEVRITAGLQLVLAIFAVIGTVRKELSSGGKKKGKKK